MAVTWSGWAVALRCLAAAYETTTAEDLLTSGCLDFGQLAAAAATPGFFSHSGDGSVVDLTCSAVKRLPTAAARKLAAAFAEAPALVWNGASSFASHANALEESMTELAAQQQATLEPAPPPDTTAAVDQLPEAGAQSAKPGCHQQLPETKLVNARSKAGRRSQLISSIQGQSSQSAVRRPAAAQEAAALSAGVAPGSGIVLLPARLASWLRKVAASFFVTPPCMLPGADNLCMDGVEAVETAIAAAPRLAVYTALTAPASYLKLGPRGARDGSRSKQKQSQMTCLHPDAATCYQLRQQTGEIGAGGWFVDFCSVVAADDLNKAARDTAAHPGADDAEDKLPSKAKVGTKRKAKRVGKGVQQMSAEEITAAAKKGPSKKQEQEATTQQLKAAIRKLPPEVLQVLGARFQAATGDLQHAGLIRAKPSTRLGTVLARATFQPPAVVVEYGGDDHRSDFASHLAGEDSDTSSHDDTTDVAAACGSRQEVADPSAQACSEPQSCRQSAAEVLAEDLAV